jgi:hypothetical protein
MAMSESVLDVVRRIEERQLIQDKRLERIDARLDGMSSAAPASDLTAAVPGGKKIAALVASLSAGAVLAIAEVVSHLLGGK